MLTSNFHIHMMEQLKLQQEAASKENERKRA
jgi:hypothetical protein